jgi:hypothetical protein
MSVATSGLTRIVTLVYVLSDREMAVVQAADLWRCGGGRCNDSGMAAPEGFDYAIRADGSVSISHRGRAVTTMRGGRAAFLDEVEQDDPQQVLARWTGQYRRGNERTAKNHPRNAHR